MIEISSGFPRKSSAIFGNLRELRLAFGTNLENLRKVAGNVRKIVKNAVISKSI